MTYLEEAYRNSSADWLVSVYLLQVLKPFALDQHEDEASKAPIKRASGILQRATEQGIMNAALFFTDAQFFMMQLRVDDPLKALEATLKLDPKNVCERDV